MFYNLVSILLVTLFVMGNVRPFYQVFQAFYALMKHILGVSPGRHTIYVKFVLVLLTSLVMALFAILLLLFELFSVMLRVYLRLKEGDDYAGIMSGQDFVWKSLYINIILTTPAKESYEEIRVKANAFIQNLYASSNKLRYLIRSCLGYGYYLKSNLRAQDYVTEISREAKPFWTEEEMINYLQSSTMECAFMKDRTWNITMFKQPLERDGGSKSYFFLLTFNHVVGDGTAIVSLMKNKIFHKLEYLNLPKNVPLPESRTLTSLDDAYVFTKIPVGKLIQRRFEMIMTFFNETESKYVPMIGQLKSKLKVSFSDVLVAGFLVAFKEYKAKKNIYLPNLKFMYALRFLDADSLRMFEGNYNYNKIQNNFAAISLYLNGDVIRNMLRTVRELRQIQVEYLGSSNLLLMKLFLRFAYLIPPPLAEKMVEKLLFDRDVIVTNMSGIGSAEFCGHEVEDITFFVTPNHAAKLFVCVLSFGSKFHISVSSGTDIVHNKEELDAIIGRAFDHIEMLHKEVAQNHCPEVN